jgi:hypothetical protein
MTAIVSSIVFLHAARRSARQTGTLQSNACATGRPHGWRAAAAVACLAACTLPAPAFAQGSGPRPPSEASEPGKAAAFGRFVAGAAAGLLAHEAGHLLFDVAFDADPELRKVDFHGIPFFAIAHRSDVSPRRAYMIASAGFLVQHVGSEWVLTRRPKLRAERAPAAKGLLTFNVVTSVAYAGAAFARTGPSERDTRGMAEAARVDERWIGAMVLAPAALDAWRYFYPEARWAVWLSRGAKVALALLVVR